MSNLNSNCKSSSIKSAKIVITKLLVFSHDSGIEETEALSPEAVVWDSAAVPEIALPPHRRHPRLPRHHRRRLLHLPTRLRHLGPAGVDPVFGSSAERLALPAGLVALPGPVEAAARK